MLERDNGRYASLGALVNKLKEQLEDYAIDESEVKAVAFGTSGIHPVLGFLGPLHFFVRERVVMFTSSEMLVFDAARPPTRLKSLLCRVPKQQASLRRQVPGYSALTAPGCPRVLVAGAWRSAASAALDMSDNA